MGSLTHWDPGEIWGPSLFLFFFFRTNLNISPDSLPQIFKGTNREHLPDINHQEQNVNKLGKLLPDTRDGYPAVSGLS